MEKFIDSILPTRGEKCALMDCTAGKLFAVIAVIGVLGSVGSWGNFVSTVIYEAIIGIIILRLCRGCHTRWPWVVLLLAAALPIIIAISFMIGMFTSAGTIA
jgi:uncharacterized membrane protein